LSFTGSGFAPGEVVQIYKNGVGSTVLANATTDSSGAFTASAKVPLLPWGPRLFLGLGQTSRKLGGGGFSISPRLVLSPTSGPVGSTVTIQGLGFSNGAPVGFQWAKPLTGLGSITTDDNGSFIGTAAFTFTVPQGSPPGVNYVKAVNNSPQLETVYALFTVE
jgi:hypothetical protein